MFDLIRFETTDLDHELFRKMGHKSSEKHCRVFSHRIKCGAEGFFFLWHWMGQSQLGVI